MSTYEELCSGIEDDLGTFIDQINEQIQRIASMLNDAAPGFVAGVVDIFSDTVDDAIDRWNNEIHPWIIDTVDQVITNVRDALGDLAGRPLSLIDYANAFSDVMARIYVPGDLNQKMAIFNHDWQGYAAENYKAVATTEDTAFLNLAAAMDAGSTLAMAAANRILTLWRNLAKEFLGWAGDLIGCFEKATEADSIISFELPAAFDLAQAIWNNSSTSPTSSPPFSSSRTPRPRSPGSSWPTARGACRRTSGRWSRRPTATSSTIPATGRRGADRGAPRESSRPGGRAGQRVGRSARTGTSPIASSGSAAASTYAAG